MTARPDSIDLNVRIGKKDIAKGCKGDGSNCPGALAVLRAAHKALPGQDIEVYVGCYDVTLALVDSRATEDDKYNFVDAGGVIDATWYAIRSPKRLSAFVSAFDNDEPVEPTSFKLHLVNTED